MLYLVRLAAKPLRVRVTGGGGCERVREEYTTNGFTFKIFFDKKGVTQ